MIAQQPTCSRQRTAGVMCAAVCIAIATTGCGTKRQQSQSIDALHKELRWQEDQIYQLQDAIEEYQQALANCRAGGRSSSNSPSRFSPTPARPSDNVPSGVPQLPEVELGEPDDAGSLPPIESTPLLEDTPPSNFPSRNDAPKPIDMGSAEVREIRLHAVLTGGIDRDGLPGDEGIQVAIEPLDDRGRVVAASGAIAIALMDHTLPAGNQRLAFWTFDARRAAEKAQQGGLSDGLLFDLMWDGQRYPAHRELSVYVRYTTSDGRQLNTHSKIRVRLPEDVAAWKKPERLPATDVRRPSTIRPVSGFEAVQPSE